MQNQSEVCIPKTPEEYSYDEDGNLTSDGLGDYTYDANNRIKDMTMHASLPGGMTRERLEFTYDFMGRRVAKKHYVNWNGGMTP